MNLGDTAVYGTRKEIPDAFEAMRKYQTYDRSKIYNANGTAQVTLDFILDERARELAGEQIRWFDLKRTGKLLDYTRVDAPDNAVNLRDYHVLRPIPQTQLDAVTNKTEFVQNQGYQ